MPSESEEENTLVCKESEKPENTRSVTDVVKGLCCALTVVLMSVTSTSSVQLLERSVPDLELNTLRFGTGTVFCCIVLLWKCRFPWIPKEEVSTLTFYSIMNFIYTMTVFVAVTLLPLATVQCINRTSSIVTGMFLFRFCWTDKTSPSVVTSAVLCVVGVVLVVQPWIPPSQGNIMTSYKSNSTASTQDPLTSLNTVKDVKNSTTNSMETQSLLANKNNLSEDDVTGSLINVTSGMKPYLNHTVEIHSATSWIHALEYLLPVLTGFSVSLDILIVKRRPYMSKEILNVFFWSSLVISFFSGMFSVILESPVIPRGWFNVLLVGLHCISVCIGKICYLLTCKYISGNTFTIVSSTSIIFTLIAQYTVLSSILPGHRNWIEVVGAILVLLGSILKSTIELVEKRLS